MASMSEKKEMESGKEDVVCFELPAPPGWKKKVLFLLNLNCFSLTWVILYTSFHSF